MVDIEKEVQEVVERLKEQNIELEPKEVRRFYVDNVIGRSFSYLFGWNNERPRKIEASSGGALKVASTGIAPPEEIKNDQVTVGTTATQLVATATNVEQVVIKNFSGNTDPIYVGHSASVSSTNGLEVGVGEALTIEIDDASKIYLISTAAGQTVGWIGVL